MRSALRTEAMRHALGQLGGVVRRPGKMLHRGLWLIARGLAGPRSFELDGESIRYFLHPLVIDTERTVEVALARRFLEHVPPEETLEIGNVLGVFHRISHRVVDKYEAGQGVENVDIVDFDPGRRYRRILSVSTLEHVGIDEGEGDGGDRDGSPRDEAKALSALAQIPGWLSRDGRALITLPLGYHPRLGEWLARPPSGTTVSFLKRLDRWGRWRQVDEAEAQACRYGDPYPCANGVAVVRMEAGSK